MTTTPNHWIAVGMGGGFMPFRKNVDYDLGTRAARLRPLLETLSFTRERPKQWGQAFRYGLFKVSASDMALIERAMSGQHVPFQPVGR